MPGRIEGYRDTLAVSAVMLPLWKVLLSASAGKIKPKAK
jgi:hypothetical protein